MADDNKLAIVLADFPSVRLMDEQVRLLEDSLAEEVDKVPTGSYVPKFLNCWPS